MATLKELKASIDQMIANAGDDWESEPIAYALFTAPDVVGIAMEIYGDDVKVTNEEIANVLDEVHSSDNSEYGMNWESIRFAVDNMKDHK